MLLGKLWEWEHIVPEPPQDKTPRDHAVRIWAGMDFNKANSKKSSLAGGIPEVVLWNERGDYAGYAYNEEKKMKGVGEGDFHDVLVNYENHNARAPYVQLRACEFILPIADIITTWKTDKRPSEQRRHLRLGRPGHVSRRWHRDPSRRCPDQTLWLDRLQIHDGNPPSWQRWINHIPALVFPARRRRLVWNPGETWILGKHMPKSVSFHIKDFDGNGTMEAYQKNPDLICNSAPRLYASNDKPDQLHMFYPPLVYHGPDANNLDEKTVDNYARPPSPVYWPMTEKKPKPKEKKLPDDLYRSVKQRASDGDDSAAEAEKGPKFQGMHELWWTLSNSTMLDDTATVLCGMPNIDGPHWASLYDRKFCKMDDHTLWDLCDETIRSNCFDIEAQQLWGEAAVAANDSSAVGPLALMAAVPSPILNLQYRLDR